MKTRLPIWHLIFLITVVLVMAVMSFTTDKTMREVNSLRTEIERQENNNLKLVELANILPPLANETLVYQKTLPSNEAGVATFVSLMESLAKGIGMTVAFHFNDFPNQVDVSGKNIYGLGSEIALEGSFQSLTTFLARLSELPYFFKVDKMMILKHDTKPGVKVVITGYLMMNQEKK